MLLSNDDLELINYIIEHEGSCPDVICYNCPLEKLTCNDNSGSLESAINLKNEHHEMIKSIRKL